MEFEKDHVTKGAELKALIDSKVRTYYRHYYWDELGLPDFEARISQRLIEDDTYIEKIELVRPIMPFFCDPPTGKTVLIDGAGTGQEFIAFSKLGYDVYALEPDEKAREILTLKCEWYGFDSKRVVEGVAEDLPFADNEFDLVWCWTVLEHVQNVKNSIHEIFRVTKPGGWAFLEMPDYGHFYEPHYKLYLPTFLPIFLQRLILKMHGRPHRFLNYGINYINTKKVRRILQRLDFDAMLKHHSWPEIWLNNRTLGMQFVFYMYHYFGNPRDQWWLLRKR